MPLKYLEKGKNQMSLYEEKMSQGLTLINKNHITIQITRFKNFIS